MRAQYLLWPAVLLQGVTVGTWTLYHSFFANEWALYENHQSVKFLKWLPQALLLHLILDQTILKLGYAAQGPLGPSEHGTPLTSSSFGPSF